jgi:hypothetical protein
MMPKPQREKPLVVTARDQTITMIYLKITMVISMLNMLALAMTMLIEGTQFGYQNIFLLLQRNPLIDGFLNQRERGIPPVVQNGCLTVDAPII